MIVAIADWTMTQSGGVLILITGFALLFITAEILRVRWSFAPETTRKLAHIVAGISILGLPYLSIARTTFVGLGIAFSLALWVTHHLGLLSSIHAVPRRSVGAILFPLAMMFLVVLPEPKGVEFTVSVLLFAISDAVSGLVGLRYGKHPYYVAGYRRSAEGSVAFFATALPLSWGLLYLQGGYSLWPALYGALILAVVITLIEAISVWGWDNLTIPVVSAGILTVMQMQNFPESYHVHTTTVAVMILASLGMYRIGAISIGRVMSTFIVGYGAYTILIIFT